MKIASTEYSLQQKTLEIYISGCKPPHCKGCHNSEIWSFDIGSEYNLDYFNTIEDKVEKFDLLIDNIWILGGEPLDQNLDKVEDLLVNLKTLNKKIWLFTRYDIDSIKNNIKKSCDYIKCGKFDIENLVDDNIQYGVQLASNNQKIYKI